MTAPKTPDGRYILVRGRLWRASNPNLPETTRESLVEGLMAARRRVQSSDPEVVSAARQSVDAAKHALGERGPVWWTDGAPDLNRRLAKNSPYAEWAASVGEGVPEV